MKKVFLIISCFVAILLLICCITTKPKKECQTTTQVSPIEQKGWELIWNDEFNGNTINSSKWQSEVDASGGGNNELQYYTDRRENSFIENGYLVIQALKEKYKQYDKTREYTSARLNTKNKVDFIYKRIDVRAKLPYGKGIWPAVWMLPTEENYGTWSASGEIDIMESLGHEPNKVYGTIHYGGKYPANEHAGGNYILSPCTFSDDFHVFRIDWEKEEIKWYVDDILYYSQNKWNSTGGNYPAPFDKPFYLILNLAVGGNWPGNPDNKTKFPQQFIIDYVRIYRNLSIPEPTPEPISELIPEVTPESISEPTPEKITQKKPCKPQYKIDKEYIPSGYMGDIKNIEMYLSWDKEYYSNSACIRVKYQPGKEGWGGVYWQNKPDNWCDKPGNNFSECGYTKCTFWAKGTTGKEVIEFICGGMDCMPYPDSFKVREEITLSKTWQQYELYLEGEDLSSVIGGFCWVASGKTNPKGVDFYIDDIWYE